VGDLSFRSLRRGQVLAALYNHASCPGGMAAMHYDPKHIMTEEDADALLEDYSYFDYIRGRLIKTHIPVLPVHFDSMDFNLYDEDNGPGAGYSALLDELTK
jgi:hypothetical protein